MFAYQEEAIEWMNTREDDRITPGGFLCHEMGLGKTHIVCKHIKNTILTVPRNLILTTKSTLNSWKDTLCTYSKFEFDVRVNPMGTGLHPDRPVAVVATHASVLKNLDWFVHQSFNRLIVDEAHIMRNRGKMFKQLLVLARTVQYRWGVTATPYNNKPIDMLAYVMYLRPAIGEQLSAEMFKHYFLRKLRDEVITDGPKLVFNKMVYDFEYPEERMMYDYVSRRIDETHDWIARNARNIPWRVVGQMTLTLIIRQRQAAIHPQLVLNAEKVWARQMGEVYDSEWDPHKVTKINKIAELVQNDQRECNNTLIITHFAEEMKLIKNRLIEDGVSVRTLDGKTTPTKRAEIEKKCWMKPAHFDEITETLPFPTDVSRHIMSFIANKPEVVIIQIQAGGVGLSLPWIHHVINTAPDWNPYLEKQSIYRAYRVTTPHDVRVTPMYFRDTIELSMQRRQADKLIGGAEWLDDPIESIADYIRMPII